MTELATVLVATRLKKTDEEQQRATAARAKLAPCYPQIYYDWELNWDQIRSHTGGFNQAYRAIAEQYNPIIIIEGYNGEYFLARGLYSIANAQLQMGIAPIVYRHDGFYAVKTVAKTRRDSWSGSYAQAWAPERWF
jgi:hypothetical protein